MVYDYVETNSNMFAYIKTCTGKTASPCGPSCCPNTSPAVFLV